MAGEVYVHPEVDLSDMCIAGTIRGDIGGGIQSDSREEKRFGDTPSVVGSTMLHVDVGDADLIERHQCFRNLAKMLTSKIDHLLKKNSKSKLTENCERSF